MLLDDPKNREALRGLTDTLYWSGQYAGALRRYEELNAFAPHAELTKRIAAVKEELAALAAVQKLRAPVGLRRPLPNSPFREYFKVR